MKNTTLLTPDAIRALADTLTGYWASADTPPPASIIKVAIDKLEALEEIMAKLAEWGDVDTLEEALATWDQVTSD